MPPLYRWLRHLLPRSVTIGLAAVSAGRLHISTIVLRQSKCTLDNNAGDRIARSVQVAGGAFRHAFARRINALRRVHTATTRE